MKLIIQIPCFNEEKTLWMVLKDIPKKIDWISIIETQIINDWSTDNTVKVAKEFKVDYIINYIWNKWLWHAFKIWIENALLNWADIVVNTDWDNQYPWIYIKDLVKPIIERKADIVIWNRQTKDIEHFSITKKFFQWFWSCVVRFLSWTNVTDTVSWFRAYSRESLLKLNIVSRFSYVLDTIIQAWKKGFVIVDVKITTNPPTRKSRLFINMWHHIKKSFADILRIYTMYEPLKVFFFLSIPFIVVWFILVSRFLFFYFITSWDVWMIQSLIISWISITIWISLISMWIVWDLILKNRIIQEDVLYLIKLEKYWKTDYELNNKNKHIWKEYYL